MQLKRVILYTLFAITQDRVYSFAQNFLEKIKGGRHCTFLQNRTAASGSDDTNIARCILNTTEIFDAPLLSEAERWRPGTEISFTAQKRNIKRKTEYEYGAKGLKRARRKTRAVGRAGLERKKSTPRCTPRPIAATSRCNDAGVFTHKHRHIVARDFVNAAVSVAGARLFAPSMRQSFSMDILKRRKL